ncbi:response regulator transcription factor [Burkholderia gladioli]|uniref:Two component LuxR family transcriptional regulator n=1 Tax=Burkholderia gladioli (strain BSR3) TaxID=999541 RepID=F2LRP6_BURGS|nr:response regulator transcription factor [Burkholderia gladioli]AEA65540.1 two component LuxR family transcriptional regulator [Burkholderia gladioli BSR3]MBW5286668.1 response regulator transcription factor [Burkholderia gladioli]
MKLIDRENFVDEVCGAYLASDEVVNFSMKKINIVIADPYPMIVQGIRHVLKSVEHMHVIADTNSLSGVVSFLANYRVDVLVCGYSFGDDAIPDGIRMVERIRRNYPHVKIVLLTEVKDRLFVRLAMQKGVSALITKSSDDSLYLPKIVERVIRDKKYLDTGIAGEILCDSIDGGSYRRGSAVTLSPRELDVVRLFEKGMAVGKIAVKLNRSRKTISTQKSSAMKKLGVKTDVELVDSVRNMLLRNSIGDG